MILIISDYHHREEKVLALIEKYKPERIFNLGDSCSEQYFLEQNNILSVKGNCDYIDLPLVLNVKVGNMQILMTHGHLYGVRYDLQRLYYLALENKANYVFFGHTHEQLLITKDGITFLNPGSLVNDNYAILDNGEITLY